MELKKCCCRGCCHTNFLSISGLFHTESQEEEKEEEEGEDYKIISNVFKTSTSIARNILVDITIPIGYLLGGSNQPKRNISLLFPFIICDPFCFELQLKFLTMPCESKREPLV